MKKKKWQLTPQKILIQGILRDYYEQLHTNKMDKFVQLLEELDKFLERYNLLSLKQEEIEN